MGRLLWGCVAVYYQGKKLICGSISGFGCVLGVIEWEEPGVAEGC